MQRDSLLSLLCELGHSKEQMPTGLAKNCYQCCSISTTMISPACCACCQASDKAKHYMDSVEAEVCNVMWLSWWKACWLFMTLYHFPVFFFVFCCGWSEQLESKHKQECDFLVQTWALHWTIEFTYSHSGWEIFCLSYPIWAKVVRSSRNIRRFLEQTSQIEHRLFLATSWPHKKLLTFYRFFNAKSTFA